MQCGQEGLESDMSWAEKALQLAPACTELWLCVANELLYTMHTSCAQRGTEALRASDLAPQGEGLCSVPGFHLTWRHAALPFAGFSLCPFM